MATNVDCYNRLKLQKLKAENVDSTISNLKLIMLNVKSSFIVINGISKHRNLIKNKTIFYSSSSIQIHPKAYSIHLI